MNPADLVDVFPELAFARMHLFEVVRTTRSTLTMVERLVAALTTSSINDATADCVEIARQLDDLGTPTWVIETVQRSAGRWTVSDDDRIDVIVDYAARLTRTPGEVVHADIQRLRAVALTDLDIVDLNNVVAYYNYINRVCTGLAG